MNAETTSSSLAQTALSDLAHELATTRRALERVPQEHLSWKPHAKSMSLAGLATHIATLPRWALMTMESDELDAAKGMPANPEATSREELLRRFDEMAAAASSAIAAADDAAMSAEWTFRHGDHIIVRQPRVGVLRGFVISHMIHHRGQLSVYLRLLDVPVPPMYGPTADEG